MKIKILILLLSLMAFQVNADTLGVRIMGGAWSTEYSGFVRDSTSSVDDINLKDDLSLKDETQSFFYLYVEHPIPLIPNIRVGQTNLTTTGNGILTANVTFNGVTYSASEVVTSKLNLDHTELTLYWSLLDNIVNFDLGLNLKNFDGEVEITGAVSGTASSSLKAVVPMIYTAIEIELPLSGLSLGGSGSFLGVGKASLTDVMIYARYETAFKLGIEGGVRTFQFNFDESPIKTEIKSTGFYLSGFVHF